MKKLSEPALILIFIVSGCSNYSKIPRQHNFFVSKIDTKTESQTKKKPTVEIEVQNKNIVLTKSDFNLLVEAPFKNDSVRLKTRVESENSYITSKNISLQLPKIYKNIIQKPDSVTYKSRTAYLKRSQFPPVLIMLGAALGLIGLIFGIGYLTEKKNGPIRESEKPIDYKQDFFKQKRNFALASLILGILSPILFISSIIVAILAWELIYLSLLIIPVLTSILAIGFGINTLLKNKKILPNEKSNRKMAIIGMLLGLLALSPLILILAFNLI